MSSVTFPVALGGDGSTVTDDSNASTGLDAGGHRTRFVPALGQVVAIASYAVAAGASAIASPGLHASSTTSLAIGTGSKAFTIQAGKTFVVGQTVAIFSAANAANFMVGNITAHNSGTGAITVNVTKTGGSGTLADWIFNLTPAIMGDVNVGALTATGIVTGLSFVPTTTATNGLGLAGTNNPALYANSVKRLEATTSGAGAIGRFDVSLAVRSRTLEAEAKGQASVAGSAWQTMLTSGVDVGRMFQFTAWVYGSSGSMSVAWFGFDNGGRFLISKVGTLAFRVSGNDMQVQNILGSTQDIMWTFISQEAGFTA